MIRPPPKSTLFPCTALFRSPRASTRRLALAVGMAFGLAAGPASALPADAKATRSEEHTSELQSQSNLVCRLLLEKKTRGHHCFYAARTGTLIAGAHIVGLGS